LRDGTQANNEEQRNVSRCPSQIYIYVTGTDRGYEFLVRDDKQDSPTGQHPWLQYLIEISLRLIFFYHRAQALFLPWFHRYIPLRLRQNRECT
jgi:hypothetical protein